MLTNDVSNFMKPISDTEKNILSICIDFITNNSSEDEFLKNLYSPSITIKH